MKLDGALASIERDGNRLLCGGGARLPQAAARAAREGLSGLEFGVNIPGTVGGAVKMNANAYGGDLSRVLEWVEVATPAGTDRRVAGRAGLLLPPLQPRPREIVARASFALEPAEPDEVKATLAGMRERRKAAQPSGIKTFGFDLQEPRRSARRGPQRRGAARRGRLPRPAGRRRSLLRQARQLRGEHRRGDHRRRGRSDGRGQAAGARALRGRVSSPRCSCSARSTPRSCTARERRLAAARRLAPLRLRSAGAVMRTALVPGPRLQRRAGILLAGFLLVAGLYMLWLRDSGWWRSTRSRSAA